MLGLGLPEPPQRDMSVFLERPFHYSKELPTHNPWGCYIPTKGPAGGRQDEQLAGPKGEEAPLLPNGYRRPPYVCVPGHKECFVFLDFWVFGGGHFITLRSV